MDARDRRYYWERFGGDEGRLPPGQDLAAFRRGAGRQAGSVPEMWRFYISPDGDGRSPDPGLIAEHHCLVLFGFHQQSKDRIMHARGRTPGLAFRELRRSERYRGREEALDSRVAAGATATSVDEVGSHLRSLVGLLSEAGIQLDYSALQRDLRWWGVAGPAERIRRAWGRDYFGWEREEDETATSDAATAATTAEG